MQYQYLFVFRIIWLILFGATIAVIAYYQDKIPLVEKLTLISISISLFISIFFCFLRSNNKQEIMTPTALEEFKIDL